SLDLPPPPTSDRIRRRSELQRSKPPIQLEAFELPTLSAVQEVTDPGLTTPGSAWGLTTGDLELATALPSATSSISRMPLVDGETNSTAPELSPAEKALYRWKSRLHFAALCWCFFLEGWNDGTTGPLLPRIQAYYGIGFATVSLLFVLNCIGFISGAVINVYLNERLGFGKVLVLGSLFQLAAYAMLSPGGPFAIMCAAFGLAGFGISLQNAQANGFVGALKKNTSEKIGLLHASYGLGAFVAPLVATHFSTTRHWSFHYLISAGIAVSNTALLSAVFRFRKQDEVLAEAGQAATESDASQESKYRQILGIRTVHLLSVFALIYVGVEVTLGGWIVTFIQEKRGGGATTGYISSGFFGGLMIGRIALMWLNKKIGERRVMFLYALLAIQLEVTVWVVPSLVENAVAVAAIGLLLGPMYPILMNYCTQILPKWLLTGSVGWIAGFGQAGSAVLPFATGLLASKFGIGSLQPLIVSMMSTLIVIWAFVPRVRRV
ncbi:MFS general substrate transporter, partial [Panus rudis PR-1116 ss-1]